MIEDLRKPLIAQAGALKMFDPMLAGVAKARDSDLKMAEVADLLGRMHNSFSAHREVTAQNAELLEARLRALGAAPSKGKVGAMSAGSLLRAHVGPRVGQGFGANARDAFVFEHLEIANGNLLAQLADRAGDTETAALARKCIEDDTNQRELINRNWVNVLSLQLASKGLPVHRPAEPDA
jgi:ferritin-like metal-binding protein YciE